MKLIVGLGNPGLRFKCTRHNIGFRVIEKIAKERKIELKNNLRLKAKAGHKKIFRDTVGLFKPSRFMNVCGDSLAPFMKERQIEFADILVVCDSLDLAFGKIRLRMSGSDGGHRGLRSIIDSLASSDFARIKIGIGRPQDPKVYISDYVLSRFTKQEERQIPRILEEAKLKIYDWLKNKKS